MSKRRGSRRRRGTVRARGRRRGMTGIGAIKAGIALTPVAVATYNGWKSGGANGAAGAIESAYTGYDFQKRTFELQNLAVGYVPVIGAIAFGKVMRKAGIRF